MKSVFRWKTKILFYQILTLIPKIPGVFLKCLFEEASYWLWSRGELYTDNSWKKPSPSATAPPPCCGNDPAKQLFPPPHDAMEMNPKYISSSNTVKFSCWVNVKSQATWWKSLGKWVLQDNWEQELFLHEGLSLWYDLGDVFIPLTHLRHSSFSTVLNPFSFKFIFLKFLNKNTTVLKL